MLFLLLFLFCIPCCTLLRCPDHSLATLPHVNKWKGYFDNYAKDKCAQRRDNWGLLTKEEHLIIAQDMFEMIQPRPTDYVFDWGSGCGTKLRYFEEHYGGKGFGIDLSPIAVRYSQAHANGSTFCLADGTNLTWIPNGTFHHTISVGALFLLYSDRASLGTDKLCDMVHELVRITKPGGRLFIGCNNGEPPRQYYTDCLQRLRRSWDGLEMEIYTEWELHTKHLVQVRGKKRQRIGSVYWGPTNQFHLEVDQVYSVLLYYRGSRGA
eukprot:EG_transcript_18325